MYAPPRNKTLYLLIFLITICIYFVLHYTTQTNITCRKTQDNATNSGFNPSIIVVGAGLSGAVMARLFATISHKRVLVVEKRNHLGGNCFDYINDDNIRVSKYGAHLFHTKHEVVWNFINQFSEWILYEHRFVFPYYF